MANTEHHGYAEMDEILLRGSASRTIEDRDAPDPRGGGGRVLGGGGAPAGLATAGGRTRRSRWTLNAQGFSALGSHSPADGGRRERPVLDNSRDMLANGADLAFGDG